MHISGNPHSRRYRSNFKEAKVTLDGKPVKHCYEADSVAGYVLCMRVNSDNTIMFQDQMGTQPAFERLNGKVRVSVAMISGETPCELARLQKTQWWKPLL